ncbi:GlxA family transcriptional regulator [Candidatus Frankia alpina]|uniref:GlxA family transcriptional regulator n=1 Tax=Candidatus Frankia alpina TaxID=2699483 RepID=UPI003AF4771F
MFDLSIPQVVLGATFVADRPGYEVVVCAADPGPIAVEGGGGGMGLTVSRGLDAVACADTVTGTGARVDADPRVLAVLRAAADAGRRIASICTGAFVLAQAGLLDGRQATTYWVQAGALSSRFPAVDVRADVLFVEDGPIVTSAGLAAGIDLCLHLVRSDYGSAVANAAARLAVAAPARAGDHNQLVPTPRASPDGTGLARTRDWALARLDEPLTLADLAEHAHVSERTFGRRFRAQTGLSPLQWLLHQRIERARELLEATDLPMDHVARRSGLGSADSLRQHLLRRTGLTPTAYRTAFARHPRREASAQPFAAAPSSTIPA